MVFSALKVNRDSMKDDKKGLIYDDAGNVLVPAESSDTLSAAMQALIETRVTAAVEQVREVNRLDLERLSREHSKKWRLLAIWTSVAAVLSFLWSAFSWLVAPAQIQAWVTALVSTRLTEPAIKLTVDEAMKVRAASLVDEGLGPLRKQIASLSEQTDEFEERYQIKARAS